VSAATADAPPLAEFRYVDTAVGGFDRRNNVMTVDEFRPRVGAVDCFRTYFRYTDDILAYMADHPNEKGNPSVAGYDGQVWTPVLPADCDDEDDPSRALNDARRAVVGFTGAYDIPPNALGFWFSGHKGVSIEIPMVLFGGFPPGGASAAALRRLAGMLFEGHPTVDYDIYDTVRLWRVENSVNGKSDRYKIPLTPGEFFTLSLDAIRQLASKPRTIDRTPDDEWMPRPELVALWQAAIPEPATDETGEPGTEGGRTFGEAEINGFVDLMRPHYKNGMRHNLSLGLGGWFAKQAIAEATAKTLVRALADDAGDDEADDRVEAVATSYAKFRVDAGKVQGWQGLVNLRIPPDTLAKLQHLLGAGPTVNGKKPNANGHGAKEEAKQATTEAKAEETATLLLTDFASYLPERKYIYMPTGKVWEPAGIDRAFPPIGDGEKKVKQSALIDEQCPVHDLTWAPGRRQIVEDEFLDQGGWIAKAGARVYNGYRPPRSMEGNPAKAGRWLDHINNVYPDDAAHMITWFAHRVQRPGEKVNHALVLGGAQGIGKDTILEPVRHAVGPWNFGDVSPVVLQERFNSFLKSVVLRVSELRDLGDRDRFGFYEHTKTVIAAPPDTVRIDEKHIRAYLVPNVVGVVFTTNHRTDGLYLPAEDRRHYVAWSDLTPADFDPWYWSAMYRWFADDGEGGSGIGHVATYLATYDLSGFDPKAPPPKTVAFWDIVAAGRAPEDADIADVIARLGEPDAVTIGDIERETDDLEFRAWLKDRKNSRQIPHRFEAVGYVATRNSTAKDGLWVVAGKRQVVYARRDLSVRQRVDAAQKRTAQSW
jgi:hypothetical protein